LQPGGTCRQRRHFFSLATNTCEARCARAAVTLDAAPEP
jgi:hypothetical protein